MSQRSQEEELDARERQELRRLLDEAEIRRVLVGLARAANRGDAAAAAAAYHRDAVEHHGPFRGAARDFAGRPRPPAPHGDFGHHVLAQSTVELSGETAAVETYFLYSARRTEPGGPTFGLTIGRYLDRMVRHEGSWQILVRRVVLDGTHDAVGSAPRPNAAEFTSGARWPDDDVYHPDRLDRLGAERDG